jgi:hypothetical protein
MFQAYKYLHILEEGCVWHIIDWRKQWHCNLSFFNQQCVKHNILQKNHAKIHVSETSHAAKFTQKKYQLKVTGEWDKFCLIWNNPKLKVIPDTPTTSNN